VYTHESPKGDIEGILDKVQEKISQSELFNPGFKYNFYVVKNAGQYSFLTAFKGEGYSHIPLFGGHIFLASADFEKNDANCKNCDERSIRDLDIIMASAATMDIIRQSMETLKYITTSKWKMEGYAEYIGGEKGYFEPSEICKKDTDNVWAQLYKRQLAVEMLMFEDKQTFEVILEKNLSYEGVQRRLKRRHCK
ncbi:MAG: hypothetical protein U9Q34_03590, partial [Elusimicrobiota bacterium]|nr:hypothetical protein [Elusimicrobiota bacterium]